jgi:hypothetical protein
VEQTTFTEAAVIASMVMAHGSVDEEWMEEPLGHREDTKTDYIWEDPRIGIELVCYVAALAFRCSLEMLYCVLPLTGFDAFRGRGLVTRSGQRIEEFLKGTKGI